MELRVLGAHNLESRHTRMESHLIDGQLALDAGSLTRSLSFAEQKCIRAVLLSHRHFDHVKDLLPLGLSLRDVEDAVDVHAIPNTLDFLGRKLLDGSLYPNFVNPDPPHKPTFTLNPVEFYTEFKVLDYTVKAVPVPHAVPAAGYLISSEDMSLFYTGDAGEGVEAAWEHVCPDVLLTECTYGNDGASSATRAGHLIPERLENVLVAFRDRWSRLPRVIVSHISPPWEPMVRRELVGVQERLGIRIEISSEDMSFAL